MLHAAVCVPNGELVRPEFSRALTGMEVATPQVQFMHVEVDSMIIGKARNVLAATAKSLTPVPDVLFFVDNDVILPAHAGRLIEEALAYGIVSGLYFNRHPPYTPQVYTLAKEPEFEGMYWPDLEFPADGIEERDAAGAGCLAVSRHVFDTLAEFHVPIFQELSQHAPTFHLRHAIARLSPYFEFLDARGEDMYFCERAREAGFKIWVDFGVRCGHLGVIEINESHFKYLVDNNLIHKANIQPEV